MLNCYQRVLELQTRFARGIGQRLDFSMVPGATAIKHDLFDAFGQSGLRSQRADALCARGICGEFVTIGCRLAGRGRCGQSDPRIIINELDMDVFVAKEDAHPRALFSAADLLAHAPVASCGQVLFFFQFSWSKSIIGRSCLLCARRVRHCSARPCLCKVPADRSCEFRRQPVLRPGDPGLRW